MKKICFVTTISFSLKTFILDAAKYLHERGDFNITFICNNDNEFRNSLPEYIKFIPISMKRGIGFKGSLAIIKLLFVFKKEKFDIVQYSSPNASFYASIAAKLAGVPVRLYCQWGLLFIGFTGIKYRILKFIERTTCMLSTWIQPDSFGNLNYCRKEKFYDQSKSTVIWNGSAKGVDLIKFNIDNKTIWRQEIRKKFQISDHTLVIGFVGRITRDKGINELFLACKQMFNEQFNIVLMLVGDIDNKNTLDQLVLEWAYNEKRVVFCGKTDEVEKYFSAMDVFVLPSYREGFGSVVIEAEAMGVPVIVTDIPGPTEAMVNGVTGLVVEKSNVISLMNAMLLLYNCSEKRKAMGKEGRKFVEKNFDQKVLLDKILEDRNRLVSLSSKGSNS